MQAVAIIIVVVIVASAIYYITLPAPSPSPSPEPSPTKPSVAPIPPPTATPTPEPTPTPAPTPALQKPTARISADVTTIRLGENITLSATESSDPDGDIVKFQWILHGVAPDPAYRSGENVTIVSKYYEDPGNYTVELHVTDNDGLTGETEIELAIILEKFTLDEAVESGYVEANITGVSGMIGGASSGDSIILHLKRLVEYVIEIEPLQTGTILEASGNAQNMAVLGLKGKFAHGELFYTPVDRILLWYSDSIGKYLFSGYCVDFEKPNPNRDTYFSVGGFAQDDVLKILKVVGELPGNVTTVAAIQTAIFVVTDDITFEQLESRFKSGVNQIDNAKIILEAADIDTTSKNLFSH
jgi:hypothetical protein